MNGDEEIPEASGPYYDLWLFREGERTYEEYWDLLGRKDAPVHFSLDVIQYLHQSLKWVPGSNDRELDLYGPNVINRSGGEKLHQICAGWAQMLSQGPEMLVLSHGWTSTIDEEGKETNWREYRFRTARDPLVQALEQLAEYGRLVASGDYFLFFLGI